MKLINIIKTIVTEEIDTQEDVLMIFGDDLYYAVPYFKKLGSLHELVDLFYDNYLRLIPPLLDDGDPHLKSLAWDLVTQDIGDVTVVNNRYILTIDDKEELSDLFKGRGGYYNDVECNYVAKQIFSEDGLEWEPYDTEEDLTYIFESVITDVNYQEIVTIMLEKYSNMEITNWREEFNGYSEEDNLSGNDDGFILTPDRILSISKDTYNFALLIDNSLELSDLSTGIEMAFNRAYNDSVVGDYHNTYNESVVGLIGDGKYVQAGSTTKKNSKGEKYTIPNYVYELDITDKFWDVINKYGKQHHETL